MSSLFKVLKDSKRRVLQTVNEAVDSSAKTVDPEYDVHATKFPEMIKDMNEIGASLNSTLVNQKKMFADSTELAKSLARIYQQNLTMTDWVNVDCHLEHQTTADGYCTAWDNIHSVVRSSSAMAISELALEPLRAAVTKMDPEITAACKTRNTKLTDFDSYRRRVKQLYSTKEKQEAKMAGANPTASDTKSLEFTIGEIARFEAKLQIAEAGYKEDNYKVKDDIIKAKLAHDQLLDLLLVTTVVCQAEMFTRAANELNALVAALPEDKVDQVRRRMEHHVAQGGVSFDKPNSPPSGALGKSVALLTGKAVLSDLKKDAEQKNERRDQENAKQELREKLAKDEMQARGHTDDGPGNPFGDVPAVAPAPAAAAAIPGVANTPPPLPIATVPSAPPVPASITPATVPIASPVDNSAVVSSKTEGGGNSGRPLSISLDSEAKFKVVGIYDHDGDADDELTFKIHDIIEVVDDTDEGWWFGRNLSTGKLGLFPVNYTQRM